MEKALLETSTALKSLVVDAEILRKTYEVMFNLGAIELVLKFLF